MFANTFKNTKKEDEAEFCEHKRGSFGCDLGQYNCLVLCLSSIPLFLGSCFEPNLILFCVFSNGCGLNSRELTHQSHCSFTSLENQLRALSKTNKPHKLSNLSRNLPLEPSHCPLISDYLLFPYFTGISIAGVVLRMLYHSSF